jgi:maltose alpha-D-glucosyltransferase/alpha-amylase
MLLAQRNVLKDRLNACISGQIKAVKSRYHGDYHLGQVLLTQNDFVITDFEGEPARPFAERRHKHSPLRDVAGMLRSFNYAAHTALAHACAEQSQDLVRFEPLVRDWEIEVGRVFLAAYDEAHSSGLLTTDAPLRGLLDLFLLEKALYEVRYELDDRPDWVAIPLYGILSLLQPVSFVVKNP